MKKILSLLAAAALLAGCQTNKSDAPQTKSLILYYSQTGATKAVAEELQRQTGADIEQIEAVQPYDGTYDQTISRCKEEMAAGTQVAIRPLKADVQAYDTVYVGYPVWFGTYAPPVRTLLGSVSLEGKVVVPFCTFGSGGLTNTVEALRKTLSSSTVLDGFGIRNAHIGKLQGELTQYLVNVGIKPGTPLNLPPYSAQKQPTEAESAVFHAACDDYPMPLGTPVSVGQRKVDGATQYLFTVKMEGGKMPAGEARIYVTAADSAGAKPEFTLVER